ncbi:cobyrinate a,c-diamide synthase [Alkalibaculum sp. M08DMB]|uniref:Cobyrinate a,c-diamide synthase n=1 Tax=Alkalibaculum sporogenes TaxID=2655001 RepID=A0A6A7KAI5_9FIRM|nr:cobyrinate a,c-diamide synthase [Alkalibaculum sporogenes]MPW26291.1 cobyrinate a,c-diamide synthase [Alkalibaculum sporogenes]
MNRFMIAGTNSGVGKTTISIGIMAALRKRKYRVAPFKTGPDYIDPGFHKYVTGNPSYNLDSYILEENHIKYLVNNASVDKDIGVIEGVMGLYDGFGVTSNIGSSAHISLVTQTPVILVIDATGMSNSAAAVVLGYKMLNQNVNIQGIIVNRVSGKEHYKLVKEIIEYHTNIKCIGYMPKNNDISLYSRHLGLIPADELIYLEDKINKLIDIIEECIDVDLLLEISKQANKLEYNNKIYDNFIKKHSKDYKNKKIGIAWDKAFTFYYQANLDILKKLGVQFIEFSPLADKKIPDNLDSVYIGGGFPEIFSKDLESNTEFKNSLVEYMENGGKCYGECGGFMYLSKGIKNLEGEYHEMLGFLPVTCEMTVKLQRFGYIEMDVEVDNQKFTTRAHEFHHSKLINVDSNIDYKYKIKKYRDKKILRQWECGIQKQNTIAGYPHLYFLSNLELMTKLL